MKIKVCYLDTTQFHPSKLNKKGKHPVHLIEGGKYITLEKFDNGIGDMSWFYLNNKEYNYLLKHLVEMEFKQTGINVWEIV